MPLPISRTPKGIIMLYALNRTRRKYSIPLPLNRTRRRYQRRRRSTDGVLPYCCYTKAYIKFLPLYLLTERGESTGDEEGGPTAYSQYVEALLMKYTVLYPRSEKRSERVWINCAAILTAISAGVSLPMSIPMGVITRASCCSL